MRFEQVRPISLFNGCLEGVQLETNWKKQEKNMNTHVMYSSAKHLSSKSHKNRHIGSNQGMVWPSIPPLVMARIRCLEKSRKTMQVCVFLSSSTLPISSCVQLMLGQMGFLRTESFSRGFSSMDLSWNLHRLSQHPMAKNSPAQLQTVQRTILFLCFKPSSCWLCLFLLLENTANNQFLPILFGSTLN